MARAGLAKSVSKARNRTSALSAPNAHGRTGHTTKAARFSMPRRYRTGREAAPLQTASPSPYGFRSSIGPGTYMGQLFDWVRADLIPANWIVFG